MALTKSEVKDQIKLKKVGGVWGISIPSDFVSAKVELKISRKDKYSKCKQAIQDSIRFADNSSNELGIRVGLAGDMDPDHDNHIDLKTDFDDSYSSDGVALVNFAIGNVSTNYSEDNADEHTEEDTLNINRNDTFYKFTRLEGLDSDEKTKIDIQDYLKNGANSSNNWPSGRAAPVTADNDQKLIFHDNDDTDNNAEMTFKSKDVEFNKKPSLKKIRVQKRDGTYISQDISDDTSTTIKIKVKPNSATGTFYQLDLTIGSGETPNLTSSNRDGSDFYESKKAIFIRDNCNDDNDDGTDYKNTLIFIKSISEIVLDGPDTNEEDEEPVVEEEVDDPDPEPEPDPEPTILTESQGPGSCPRRNETPWTLPWGGTWGPNYIPTCAAEPVTVTNPGGALSLTRDPNNKKRVVLSFSDISGTETGKELREQLNLKNSTPNRSLANKLITLKVTYSKTAGWANSLVMTASCSDIRKPDTTLVSGGAPYSRPSVSEDHAEGDPNVTNQVYYFYNVDGSSTIDFVFDTSNTDEPSRCYFTGESLVTTGPVSGTDAEGNPTLTYTETRTCIPNPCITETYSQFYQWPPCPVEAYVTKTGGTTVSAVFSDGHWDGANDQTITIEWVAMRESAIDIWANDSLNLQEAPFGIAEKLRKFVWLTSSTADDAENLGAVDGLSLIDYHKHSDKIRFRNPVTRTSAINLANDGTSILELEGHSGALLPGTIDTKISNAVAAGASLPINLSYY